MLLRLSFSWELDEYRGGSTILRGWGEEFFEGGVQGPQKLSQWEFVVLTSKQKPRGGG